MREQVEILIYQYKKQNNLDVYSGLDCEQQKYLINNILNIVNAIECKTFLKHEERIMPNV